MNSNSIKRSDRKVAAALHRGRQATNVTAYSFLAMTGRELTTVPGLDLRVDLMDGSEFVDFLLYNDSTLDVSVQGIYVEAPRLSTGRLAIGSIHAGASGVAMDPTTSPVALPGFVRRWQGNLLTAEAVEPATGLGTDAFLTMRFNYENTSFIPVYKAKEAGEFRIVLRLLVKSTQSTIWVCTTHRRIAGPTRVPNSRERMKIAGRDSWKRLRQKLQAPKPADV